MPTDEEFREKIVKRAQKAIGDAYLTSHIGKKLALLRYAQLLLKRVGTQSDVNGLSAEELENIHIRDGRDRT